MRKAQWWKGFNDLEFNVISMDYNRYKSNPTRIYTNHYQYAPDLTPGTNFDTRFSGHETQIGEGIFNFLFDNMSVSTLKANQWIINKNGEEGWNLRHDSQHQWRMPRELGTR